MKGRLPLLLLAGDIGCCCAWLIDVWRHIIRSQRRYCCKGETWMRNLHFNGRMHWNCSGSDIYRLQSRRDIERGAVNTGQQWWQNNKRENYCTSDDDDDGGIVAEGGGCFCGQIVNLTAVTVRQLVSSTCIAFIACGHCSGLWVTDWLKLELLKVKSCLHNSYDIRTGQYYTCHRSIDVCMGYKKWWLSPFRHCGGVMI